MTKEDLIKQLLEDKEVPDNAKLKCSRGMLCFEWEEPREDEEPYKAHSYMTLPQFYST